MGELPAGARLGAVRLRVADADLEREFYEAAVGLRTLSVADGITSLGPDGGTPLVELLSDPDAAPRPTRSTGLFHLAILTPTRADLAQALRRVVAAGWRLSGASDHLVSEALYLADSEGNGIELYYDRPREQWRTADGELQMATLPLDVDGLLAEPEPASGDIGLPTGTTLGHVHLQVGDLDAAEAFWADAMGFDVVVRGYPGALFVSAGGYHHHVGLNTWTGVGAPKPPPGSRGLVHFELVLPDEASVDAVAERLGRVGAPIQRADAGVLAADPSGNAVLVRAA